jgi:hypothetical protein
MREYGRLGFVADEVDLVVRGVLADGLGGNDAGRSGAEDDVFHAVLLKEKGRSGNRPCRSAAGPQSPRRARVSAFSWPFSSQPRAA